MNTYETTATVEEQGHVRLSGVPFAPGTQVEVSVSLKRRSPEEFAAAWRKVCGFLRSRPAIANITDDEIGEEISRYRAPQ